MIKVIQWVVLNAASVCGIVQAVLKFAKELITALLNLLSALVVLLPGVSLAKANQITIAVRTWIENIDAIVQKATDAVLKFSHKE